MASEATKLSNRLRKRRQRIEVRQRHDLLSSIETSQLTSTRECFYTRSGLVEWNSSSDSEITEHIRSQVLNTDDLSQMIRTINHEFHPEKSNISICGVCGVKDFGNFQTLTVDDLEFLRVRFNPANLDLRLRNITTDQHGNHFHLHSSEDGPLLKACNSCLNSIRKDKKIPHFSLANGYDFGNISVLPLLLPIEKLLISRVILFSYIYKISPDGQNGFKGHSIAFQFNGPETFLTQMPNLTTVENITVVFKGNKTDLFRLSSLKSFFQVRTSVVYLWLDVLKANNTLYHDIEIESHDLDYIQSGILSKVIVSDDDDDEERFPDQNVPSQMTSSNIDPLFLNVNRSADPICEFTDNDSLILRSFPYLFLFGKGIPTRGSLSQQFLDHLLFQFDGRFATEARLLFLLFNQKQRHLVARSVSKRLSVEGLKIDVNSNVQILKILKNASFEDSLKEARMTGRFPALLQPLLNHMNITSSALPLSSGEAKMNVSRLVAMLHYFGLPAWWLTISPPEFDNWMSLELAHNGSNLNRITLCNSKIDRVALCNSNPVAIARGFSNLLQKLVENLFKCPLWNIRKTGEKNHQIGILGELQAYFIVIESQARGSLHAHALLWGTVPPKMIQRLIDHEPICNELNLMLDSMIRAYFPLACHSAEAERHFAQVPATSTFLNPVPCPLRTPEQYYCHYYQAAIPTHVHSKLHAPTCHKGRAGKTSCRMGFPQGIIEKTGFLELHEENGDIISKPPCPQSPQSSNDVLSAIISDKRIIVWELARPFQDDTWVVSHSPVLATVTGGNTHTTPLGSLTQALSVIYYLTDYMCKSVQELNVITDAIKEVRNRILQSSEEIAQSSILQRLINNLHGAQEISSQLASYILLGNNSWHTAEIFWSIYPLPALQKVKSAHRNSTHLSVQLLDDSDEDFVSLDPDDEISFSSDDVGVDLNNSADEEDLTETIQLDFAAGDTKVYSSVFKTLAGEEILIPPYEHYRFRGKELQSLCFYEYFGLIAVTLIKKKSKKEIGDESEDESKESKGTKSGRPHNQSFRFSPSHPLAHTHHQTLRSKLAIPLIAGTIPREMPSLAPFMITLFVPWIEDQFIIPIGITVSAFKEAFTRFSNSSNPIEQGKAQIIENILQSRSVSTRAKRLITKWRHRCTIPWSNLPLDRAPPLRNAEGYVAAIIDEDIDEINLLAALEEINRLRSRENDNSTHPVQGFLERQQSSISKVFPVRGRTIPVNSLPQSNPLDCICSLPFSDVIERSLKLIEPSESILHPISSSSSSNGTSLTDKLARLNIEQMKIYTTIMEKTQRGIQHLSFLQGGPGVGKTFLSTIIIESIQNLCRKVAVCAPTGIAASYLPQGMTINSLFSIPCRKNESSLIQPLGIKQLEKLRRRLEPDLLSLIVIDEISMVTSEMINSVDQRLRQVVNNSELPFGGISILAVGDFYQLKPACGTPLYANLSGGSKKLAAIDGWNRFFSFDLYELKTQVRSKDSDHTKRLAQMKLNPGDILRNLSILSPADQTDFQTATILVASNQERTNLNHFMVRRFALQSGQPILRWRKKVSQQLSERLTAAEIEMLYQSDHTGELHCYFVRSAPAYLSENICPEKGIANGSAVILDSITIHPDELTDHLVSKIAAFKPGEIIDIPSPSFVNVITQNGHQCVPVGVSKIVKHAKTLLKVPYFRHGYELGFSVTIHKSQGSTLNRVILDLNSRVGCAGKLGQLNWHSLYVALSRVERSAHIRLLEPHSCNNFTYLERLRPSTLLTDWFRKKKSQTESKGQQKIP
jgi:hypothetical protein